MSGWQLVENSAQSYERYLVNQLREAFGFEGSPIRIQVRSRRRKTADSA